MSLHHISTFYHCHQPKISTPRRLDPPDHKLGILTSSHPPAPEPILRLTVLCSITLAGIQGQSFQSTGFLDRLPTVLRVAVSGLKIQYESEGD